VDKAIRYAVYIQNLYDQHVISHDDYLYLLRGGYDLVEYLPTDGSKPMTGDLIPYLNRFKLDTDLYLQRYGGNFAEIATGAGDLRGLRLNQAYFSLMRPAGSFGLIDAPYHPTYHTSFRSMAVYPTYLTVMDLYGGLVDIPRGGNITGLAGKTLDFPLFKVSGVAGVDGTFTTVDGKTVTVSKGLITSIV